METFVYINEFSDECMPCGPTLGEWATWLAGPSEQFGRDQAAEDGAEFPAHCADISRFSVVRLADGSFRFTPDLPATFDGIAVSHGPGAGWFAEDLYTSREDLEAALTYDGSKCEHIAVIRHHAAPYILTYHAQPVPHCTMRVGKPEEVAA